MANSGKEERRKVEEKEEEEEEEKRSVKTVHGRDGGGERVWVGAFTRKRKVEKEEKRCRSKVRQSRARMSLKQWRIWLLLLLLLGQGRLGVSAASEGLQKDTAVAFRMRGEMQFKEERQTKSFSYTWKQPKGEESANMK